MLGPIGGTLLATAIKAIFDIGSTIFQNKYNAPKAQLKRLRQAGLPLSYMYKGNVATQSQAPQLSIDPTLGTMQKAQSKKLKIETNMLNDQDQILDMMSGITRPDGTMLTNRGEIMLAERDQKRAAAFLTQNQAELKEILKKVENTLLNEGVSVEVRRQELARIKQQITNMGKQAGLMTQLSDIRKYEEWLNNTLTTTLSGLPEWQQAILTSILKLFHTRNFN